MRINEIARQHGLENKEILEYLKSIGVERKSHSSSVDEGTKEMILEHFFQSKDKVESEEPKKSKRFAKIRRPKNYKAPEKPVREEKPQTEPAVAAKAAPTAPPVEEPPQKPKETPVAPEKPPVEETPTAATVEEETVSPAVEAKEKGEVSAVYPEKENEKEKKELQAKKDKDKVKKGQKQPEKPKKHKPKTIPLASVDKSIGEPTIVIEAPELKEEQIAELEKKKTPIEQRDYQEQRDQDDAIRREIQKLKAKQRKVPDKEEEKDKKQVRTTRRRPQPTVKVSKGKRAWKREKRERLEQQIAAEEERMEKDKTTLKIHEATTVADIADGLGLPPNELITKLIGMGVMASINQRLDKDTIHILADDYGFEVEEVDLYDSNIFTQLWEDDVDQSRMQPRPPVVTVMGHVDHGKTKLLDAVRKTDVVSGEAGGITQHIGAYHVVTPGGEIVFLDTPGHEAFTAMRARGAMVTDIVVLVIAATEGVKPQTKEAIAHAKAADVPIIVALNKMDLEGANPEKVKQELAQAQLLPEDWGGDTVVVPISAINGEGIDNLVESLLLQAEIMELKADPSCRARGTIVEGRLEQGRGAVATVLMQQGTLRVGEPFVTGVYSGRIRAMNNDRGESIEEAGPTMPVEIIGIEDVPTAGDPFIVVRDDSQAKEISTRLQQIQRERELRRTKHITLDDLHWQIEEGQIKELRVILKGDVQGSVQALMESLLNIESEKVRIEVIHSGVGTVTESDVMLASASNALIIGFNIRPQPSVLDVAKREHVEIRTYQVIYDAIEDIKKAMTGMLDKTFEENILGRAEVREVFKTSRGFSIAGLYVTDGKLQRNSPVRLLRDSVVIHDGKLSSLKRFKDDVREVASGYECGIGLENFGDIREGDEIECYEMKEVASTL